MSLNHYQVLESSPADDLTTIKKKFRKLAKQYHPDVNPNGRKHFEQITEAWEWVQTNHQKTKDTCNNHAFDWHQSPNKQAHERSSRNLNDIFEMFRNIGAFSPNSQNTQAQSYKRTIQVDVHDCFREFSAVIEFPEQSGQLINLNFPKGLSESSNLNFQCQDAQGNPLKVILIIKVKSNSVHSVDNLGNLIIEHTVSVQDALENLPIQINHPDEQTLIHIENTKQLFQEFLSSGKFIEIKYSGLGFYINNSQTNRNDAIVRIKFAIN
jgi:DnaJ-class molecular chaperone